MLGLFLISYVCAPLVLLGWTAGIGLLVHRVSGRRLPAIFVLPVGFATVLAVVSSMTSLHVTARLTAPALVLAGMTGLVLERRRIAGLLGAVRDWGWAAAGAAGAYAMVIAPAILTFTPTWTGYTRIVDLSTQFEFATWLAQEGRVGLGVRDSSFGEVISKTVVTGYPGAGAGTVGALGQVLGTAAPWVYQSFMAFTAAMLALAVIALLRRLVAWTWLRGAAGFVAAQPSLLYGYGLVGGIKELTTAFALVLVGAVAGESRPARDGVLGMLPMAIAAAACFDALSLTIVPALAVLLAIAVLWTCLRRRGSGRLPGSDGPAVRTWAITGVLAAVIAAPMLYWATQLAKVASAAQGPNATALIDLGNLAAPIPVREAAGVWISGDYRVPTLGDTPLTHVIIAVVVILAAVGLVRALLRRELGVLALTAAVLVALLYFTQRTGPWIQLKAIAMCGPVALALAFAGASAVVQSARLRRLALPVGLAGAAAVSFGVLLGNAQAYHDTTLTPAARMRDLERVGQRYAGRGRALYPAHEEYAEFFLHDAKGSAFVNPAAAGAGYPLWRPEVLARAPQPSFAFDLDAFQLGWVEKFPLVIQPRGPLWSRPPANYRRIEQTPYLDIWQQTAPEASVLVHVPVPGGGPAAVRTQCRDLVARAGRAGPGARVAWSTPSADFAAQLGQGDLNVNWRPEGDAAVRMNGPGFVRAGVGVPASGSYRVWIQGPNQRPVRISMDGRRIATFSGDWAYPQRWTLLATMDLRAGRHLVRLDRRGGRPWPGDGAGGQPVGPVILERVAGSEQAVRTAPASQAAAVCGRAERYDWVELLRG